MSDDRKGGLVPLGKVGGALVPTGKAAGRKGAFLARIREAKAETAIVPVAPRVGDRRALVAAALAPKGRPKLVFGIDATASRERAWSAARRVTESLFRALPGELDVNLAVHGASTLHTWTEFTSDPAKLRDKAARVECRAGETRLNEILDRARTTPDCRVVLYVGDVYEEDLDAGLGLCDALKIKGTKLIVLHDDQDGSLDPHQFRSLALRTGGAVLPFSADSLDQLRDLLQAIAVLAVGGVKLLEAKRRALPGARLLLEHLGRKDDEAGAE